MTFTSLEELNTAIHISLLDFNEKVMAGREDVTQGNIPSWRERIIFVRFP